MVPLVTKRILVADSNPDSADSLALLLELNGHRAVTAANGPDALALAATFHPEAVFLSLGLPHIGGLEVARILCAELQYTRPRLLVALTGDGRESAREASRSAGFDHHVLKPADPETILKLLKAIG